MIVHRSIRFYFDSTESAAEVLTALLDHARLTEKYYRFGPTTFEQVYASGLTLEGDVEEVAEILEKIDGSARFDD